MRDLEGTTTQSQGFISSQEETVKIPLSNMRKVIAKRLTQSVQESPHFYLKVGLGFYPLDPYIKSPQKVQ